jgi:hypothetical protein
MNSRFVYRCRDCKSKCHKVVEDVNRTASRCVLVEANKFTRKSAKNEKEAMLRAWANAALPARMTRSRHGINVYALEKATCLMNGTLSLAHDREFNPMVVEEDSQITDASGTDVDEDSL